MTEKELKKKYGEYLRSTESGRITSIGLLKGNTETNCLENFYN